jgi:hypothetical protein
MLIDVYKIQVLCCITSCAFSLVSANTSQAVLMTWLAVKYRTGTDVYSVTIAYSLTVCPVIFYMSMFLTFSAVVLLSSVTFFTV